MWYIYIIKIEIYHIRRSVMKRKLNPVGFLSCISIISLMGVITNNRGWFGFLGFLYYFRYFWIIPDESFRDNIKKSATVAFFCSTFFFSSIIVFNKILNKTRKFCSYIIWNKFLCRDFIFYLGNSCFGMEGI